MDPGLPQDRETGLQTAARRYMYISPGNNLRDGFGSVGGCWLHVGSMLAHVGYVAVWPQGGLKLGQVGLVLASSWPHVGSSWLQVGLTLAQVGSSWPHVSFKLG